MKENLAAYTDPKSRTFLIVANYDSLQSKIQDLMNIDPDDEDYGINHVEKGDPDSDERYTQEERSLDEKELARVLHYSYPEWLDILEKMPKKKNGTFAKGRVLTLHRAHSYGRYWEESYGWNAPEIRVKATGDLTAEVSLDFTVVGY